MPRSREVAVAVAAAAVFGAAILALVMRTDSGDDVMRTESGDDRNESDPFSSPDACAELDEADLRALFEAEAQRLEATLEFGPAGVSSCYFAGENDEVGLSDQALVLSVGSLERLEPYDEVGTSTAPTETPIPELGERGRLVRYDDPGFRSEIVVELSRGSVAAQLVYRYHQNLGGVGLTQDAQRELDAQDAQVAERIARAEDQLLVLAAAVYDQLASGEGAIGFRPSRV